jgi:hypothetical protein
MGCGEQYWLRYIIYFLHSVVYRVPTLADRGCCVVSAADPHGR